MWVPTTMVLGWATLVSMSMALLYGFSIALLDQRSEEVNVPAWRLKFVLAETVDDVLAAALEPKAEELPAAKDRFRK